MIKPPHILNETQKITVLIFGEYAEDEVDLSFSKMYYPGNRRLSATEIINDYPELTPNYIHELKELNRIPNIAEDSQVYFFGDDRVVKYFSLEDPENLELFYNEIIIGLELNKLNSSHFIRTLGFYTDENCKIPGIDKQGCVYLYLEKIKGVTLHEFIVTANFIEIKRVILKLFKPYNLALKKLNFTHYDLHLRNIMVRNDGSPVFIDFGASHISLPEGDLGEDFKFYGRYADRSLWIYDFFKLFAMMWRISYPQFLNTIKGEILIELSDWSKIKYQQGDSLQVHYEKVKRVMGKRKTEEQFGSSMKFVSECSNIHKDKNKQEQLNQFALKVLQYFSPEMSEDLLLKFTDADPSFTCFATPEGEKADFDQFVDYVFSI